MTTRQKIIGSIVLAIVVILVFAAFAITRTSSSLNGSAMSLAAGGSSTDADEPEPSPAEPTPDPTPPEVVWAGDVCAATINLRDASADLALDALTSMEPSGDIGEQVTDELATVMEGLTDPLEQVGYALGSVPVDYVDDGSTFMQAKNLTEQTIGQVQDTIDAAAAVREEDSVFGKAILAASAVATGKTAIDSGTELVEVLRTIDQDRAYRDAFSQAPECDAL